MVRNDIKKEFGDYQTPGYFAVKVCNLLKDKLKISPAGVIFSSIVEENKKKNKKINPEHKI